MRATLACLLIAVSSGWLAAGDWPHWRGPARNDVVDESSGYADSKRAGGQWPGHALWDANVGEGGSSPLVVGKNVFAFGKRTGKSRWRSEIAVPAGHNGGPVPLTVEGKPCVAVLAHPGLVVARLDGRHAGKTVATVPWETTFSNNIATAAVHESSVVITSSYNLSAICRIDVTLEGAKTVWKQPYASKVCTPVIHKGHVYWCWNAIHCLDWETGRQRWKSNEEFGAAGSCVVTADDRLVVWADGGDLLLVETAVRSPDRYRVVAQTKIPAKGDVWPHVVVAGGRLYCKDRSGQLRCLALPGS